MQTTESLIKSVNEAIVDPIISLLMVVAILIFIWGILEFIKDSNDGEKRKSGVKHMIWGVVGLAIMFTATGIVNLLISLWK